ncbi:MAG TPA: hypothetical protein VKF80_02800 [Candidatus Eisenbacteria bacterium]|nr:hypothetical protein [Candidatus Eisenbacteria bacterium]
MISRPASLSLVLGLAIALFASPTYAQDTPAPDSLTSAPADTANVVPQRDAFDVLRSILGKATPPSELVTKTKRGLSLTLLPSVGYNPAYGAYVGASIALGGWLGDPENTSISAGSLSGSYAFSGQVSFQFKSDFYTSRNGWALKGDWRYLDTSQPTFGLGPTNPSATEYPMNFKLYRFYQAGYKRLGASPVYAGVGVLFDRYDEIHDLRAEAGESTPYTEYSGGAPSRSQSVGLSANVLVDTRDNGINAYKGFFWNASLRSYLPDLGSDQARQALWSDFRTYTVLPAHSHNVLAAWNYLWFTFGHSPYLDLPAVGWDTYGRSGRGYVQGHIRGTNQAYLELEYRMQLTRDGLFGAVGFVNFTSTTTLEENIFVNPDLGFGGGLRIKFTKRTRTNLALDAARGQDDKTRFFLALQEAY